MKKYIFTACCLLLSSCTSQYIPPKDVEATNLSLEAPLLKGQKNIEMIVDSNVTFWFYDDQDGCPDFTETGRGLIGTLELTPKQSRLNTKIAVNRNLFLLMEYDSDILGTGMTCRKLFRFAPREKIDYKIILHGQDKLLCNYDAQAKSEGKEWVSINRMSEKERKNAGFLPREAFCK